VLACYSRGCCSLKGLLGVMSVVVLLFLFSWWRRGWVYALVLSWAVIIFYYWVGIILSSLVFLLVWLLAFCAVVNGLLSLCSFHFLLGWMASRMFRNVTLHYVSNSGVHTVLHLSHSTAANANVSLFPSKLPIHAIQCFCACSLVTQK
jgi:hypothetical protein